MPSSQKEPIFLSFLIFQKMFLVWRRESWTITKIQLEYILVFVGIITFEIWIEVLIRTKFDKNFRKEDKHLWKQKNWEQKYRQ